MVKRIYVSPEDFSVENGLLTPTLKLKRNVAAKHFAAQINDMYKKGEIKDGGQGQRQIKSNL
jgi:long-chain acyl-CoA synthetase